MTTSDKKEPTIEKAHELMRLAHQIHISSNCMTRFSMLIEVVSTAAGYDHEDVITAFIRSYHDGDRDAIV